MERTQYINPVRRTFILIARDCSHSLVQRIKTSAHAVHKPRTRINCGYVSLTWLNILLSSPPAAAAPRSGPYNPSLPFTHSTCCKRSSIHQGNPHGLRRGCHLPVSRLPRQIQTQIFTRNNKTRGWNFLFFTVLLTSQTLSTTVQSLAQFNNYRWHARIG